MILFYAIGGGLGHLSRVRKIMNQWSVPVFKVITACNDFKLVFQEENIIQIQNSLSREKKALSEKIEQILNDLKPEKFVIDTFPLGLLGELNNVNLPGSIELVYICRNLKWKNYRNKVKTPFKFDYTYLVEEPEKEHLKFIENYSQKISILKFDRIDYPSLKYTLIKKFQLPEKKEIWVIVHSSNEEELKTLINYALEVSQLEQKLPFFLIISNIKIEVLASNLRFINYYPSNEFFSIASRIFTGCGFNIMFETEMFASKHYFIPFERKYDNQYLRAKKRRQKKKLLK